MWYEIYIDGKLKKTFRFPLEGIEWPRDLSWEELVKEKMKFTAGILDQIFTEVVPVYSTAGVVTVFMCFNSKANKIDIKH